MIEETYCSFEIAKLLKEKGFDEECIGFYTPEKEIHFTFLGETNSTWLDDSISAPTLQTAMKWLREEHKMFICMLFLEDKDAYGFTIEHLVSKKYIATSKSDEYSSYEQACEAAIKYCLENLI